MGSTQLLALVIISIASHSLADVTDNRVDSQEESPLADVAKEIFKEKNLENMGGIVNSFIQSGGAKQLMNGVLENLADNAESGNILESIGGFLNSVGSDAGKPSDSPSSGSSAKHSKDDIDPLQVLSGLGSFVSSMQGAGGAGGQGDTAALLQGLGSVLGGQNTGGEGDNAAFLLHGLSSLMNSANPENNGKQGDGNVAGTLLQGLGSVLGAAASGKQGGHDGAESLLQGLSSLLGAGQGNSKGALGPNMIGNVISMLANSQDNLEKETVKPSRTKPRKKASSKKTKQQKPSKTRDNKNVLPNIVLGKKGKDSEADMDFVLENFPLIVKMARSFAGPVLKKYLDPLDDIIYIYNEVKRDGSKINFSDLFGRLTRIYKVYEELYAPKHIKSINGQDDSLVYSNLLNLAGAFLNQGNENQVSNFLQYLPMIMNTINAFTGEEAQERAKSHSEHSWSLPPVLERIHILYDNFRNSDLANQLMEYIGEMKFFKVFHDETGSFSFDKFTELIENHSFRRHWIQQLADKLIELLILVSKNLKGQSQYIDMGVTFINSYFQNSGFPKKFLLDTKRPAESITNFANFAGKKYLDAEIDAEDYVEPVVLYIQNLLSMATQHVILDSEPRELTQKVTDTINMDIIEPIIRVNRAYRFSKSHPKCDRYIFCIVNQEDSSNNPGNLPSISKSLYKGSSLIAAWFLTSHTGTSYFDLYDAITKDKNCQDYHQEVCNGFHHEEVKVTTEYIHNEL